MLCRDFVLYGVLVGTSYAAFGTKSCAPNFSEDATWGEDTTYDPVAADAAEFPNAAQVRVLRWKCNCDKYVANTATTGDCSYESAKLQTDGTASTTETEFVAALGYYNFNSWAPSPRTGKSKTETEKRLYNLWATHQADRSTDVQSTAEGLEKRRKKLWELAKQSKLEAASELIQLKGGAEVEVGGCGDWSSAEEAEAFPDGVCWSGICTQRRIKHVTIPAGAISGSAGYVVCVGHDGKYDRTLHDGDAFPTRIKGDDDTYKIDTTCPGTQDKYCADWTIPSGCTMLTSTELRSTYVNVPARFKELATAEVSSCSGISFEVVQFWSKTGMPCNGEFGYSVNEFNVPFDQKWNAYYFSVRENPEIDAANRFRVAVQVLSCEHESVASQVFSQGNQDTFGGFCAGQLSWAQSDGIWRKIVGEIHYAKKFGLTLAPISGSSCPN